MTPSWRKPAGALGIVAFITIWVIVVASFSSEIGALAWPLQVLIYGFAGLVWIAPLRPVLIWMEAGSAQ